MGNMRKLARKVAALVFGTGVLGAGGLGAGALAVMVPQAAHADDGKGCTLGVMAKLPVVMDGLRVRVPVKVNGRKTDFWIDSGAFFSFMPLAKSKELDLHLSNLPYWFRMIGIGGDATVLLGTAKDFEVAGLPLHNVEFIVGGSDVGNAMLGRNLLAIADTEFDLAHGSIKLIRPDGCDKLGMAYWAPGKSYFEVPLLPGDDPHDHEFGLPVELNGARIHAEYDSGSPTSIISKAAALKAGIDLNGPDVKPVSGIGGLGRHRTNGWLVTVAKVAIGNEQILRSRIEVIDGPIVDSTDGPDMLLGADYMLAHHIYVARRQKKIYFTYTGGKPFYGDDEDASGGADKASAPLKLPAGMHLVKGIDEAKDPVTAKDFALRGHTRMAQRNSSGAIADFSDAIRLAPDDANYYAARAEAYADEGKADLAARDVDKALALDPTNADLLIARGYRRLNAGDRAGALDDAEKAAKLVHSASLNAGELANLFEGAGQPRRAVTLLDEVIKYHKADSSLPMLLNNRCWARAVANIELDEALDDCKKAVHRSHNAPYILDSRAFVYFRMGQYAKAEADYDAILAKTPKAAWSLYMRGQTRLREGKKAAGEADIKAALAISPEVADRAKRYKVTG